MQNCQGSTTTVEPPQLGIILGWNMQYAKLTSFLYTLLRCSALTLSMPYGIMADYYGRKLPYVCGIVGILLGNTWIVVVCVSLASTEADPLSVS